MIISFSVRDKALAQKIDTKRAELRNRGVSFSFWLNKLIEKELRKELEKEQTKEN